MTSSAPHTVQPRGHLELAERDRDRDEADERGRHLQERQRPRVVARRIPLHRRDLQRRGERAREHERVAERRSAGRTVQEQQARRPRSATPAQTARGTGVPKSASAMSGVKTTYSPVMKPVLDTVVSSSPAVWNP